MLGTQVLTHNHVLRKTTGTPPLIILDPTLALAYTIQQDSDTTAAVSSYFMDDSFDDAWGSESGQSSSSSQATTVVGRCPVRRPVVVKSTFSIVSQHG